MDVYEVVKNKDEYIVMLPPLHWSESDVLFFRGTKQECIDRVKSWKQLMEGFYGRKMDSSQ